ncbi:MAG: hypothetical protein WD691_11400 [Acidimicrobiales bacterium]
MGPVRRLPGLLVAIGLVLLLAQGVVPTTNPEPDSADLAGLPTGLVSGLVGTLSTTVSTLVGVILPGDEDFGEGACDVDGVRVSYRTSYRSATPLGYDVTDAVLSGIAWPSCKGAVLSVVLGDGSTVDRAKGQRTLASSNVTVTGATATATVPVRLKANVALPPDAAWISTIGVTLSGGATPTPAECTGMRFSRTIVGTVGDDVIHGSTIGSDLIYSLDGKDWVDSGLGNDCVVTGADALGDFVTLGLGNSVAVTGAGADTIRAGITAVSITVGVGKYKIFSGAGNDTISIGAGIGSYVDAGPGDDTCRVSPLALQITIVNCEHKVKTL